MLPFIAFSIFVSANEVKAADITDKVVLSNVKIKDSSTGEASDVFWHGKGSTTKEVLYTGEFSFPTLGAGDIKGGDYFTIKVPDGLTLAQAEFDLKDTNSGEVLGKVVADNATGVLTFTFNDKVEDKQNVKGDFNASSNAVITGVENTVTYILPGGTQTITFKPYDDVDTVSVEGEVVVKGGWATGTSKDINWWVRVNRGSEDLTGKVVKVVDSIDTSAGSLSTYIENSFELIEVTYETTDTSKAEAVNWLKAYKITTDSAVYKADSDNYALLSLKNGGTSFELLLPTNTGTKAFSMGYKTTNPGDGTKVVNSIGVTINGEARPNWKSWDGEERTETTQSVGVIAVQQVGASVSVDLAGKIKITKYDEADATVKLSDVEFDIINKDNPSEVYTVKTDENGIAISPVLSNGKYIVKEKTPKAGYVLRSDEFEVEMTGEAVPLSISNKRETVDFQATKTWSGGQAADYKQVSLGLYVRKAGEDISAAKPVGATYKPEVTENNGTYTYVWANQLPKYDTDGVTELVYSVRELEDITGLPLNEGDKIQLGQDKEYIVSYNADQTAVTNTYDVPKINVTANKTWVGGNDEKRPEVFFKLYQSVSGGAEEEVAGADVKAVPTTDGSVTWSDLPKTTEAGVEITYSVKEVTADGEMVTTVGGYTATQTDSLTVTNTYEAQPTTAVISATKELVGRQLNEGEFEFTLTDAEGGVVEKVKNAADGKVTFKELEFDTVGTFEYTITEIEGNVTGVTYDKAKMKVTITVKDNGEGKLVATVAYEGDEAKFVNTFEEPTTTTTTTTPETTAATTSEATTTSSTTTEATTTSETTSEATTTSSTTTEATTTSTTTTEAPTTSTITTEATTTSSTTTEATTTSETTSEATTSSETTTDATTTTVEPTTTTVEPTTIADTTAPPGTTTQTPPPSAKKGKTLPKTGEEDGLVTSLLGLGLLTVAGVAVMLYRKSKKA